MRKRVPIVCASAVLVAALAALLPVPAQADSIVLRPSSVLDLDFEGNGFFFVAEGFSARQNIDSTVGVFFGANPGCDPCNVGETFNPSFTTNDTFMGNGPATVANTTYSNVAFFGDLSFAATPRSFPATAGDGVNLQTPFTFAGQLRGFDGNQMVFSIGLTGVGFASRFFDRLDERRFVAGENRLSYFFSESRTATPEPASLMLLATGIVGLVARRRLRGGGPSR